MTICVSVKVGEGLVLAADSAVTLEALIPMPGGGQANQIIQNFNFANKVAHFKDYPIGVLNWGLATINARSLHSLIMEFEYTHPGLASNPGYDVNTIATQLFDFLKAKYDAAYPVVAAPAIPVAAPNPAVPPVAGRPVFGILVGGYSSNEFFAEMYKAEYPNEANLIPLRPVQNGQQNFGADWFGLKDALIRLIKGFDLAALDQLINRGVDAAIIQQWVNDAVSELPIVFDGMPLQDAIDFAEYAAQVVIGRYRFGVGAQLCGGDIDIAVITPSRFDWAQRKRWGIHHE